MVDTEGALSFAGQEYEDDCSGDVRLKRPEHSISVFKKDLQRKKSIKGKKLSKMRDDLHTGTLTTSVSELNKGEIPSAAAIHAARKKREMARSFSSGVSPNQIMIKKTGHQGVSDDENSEDESQTVRQFGVSSDPSKQMEVLSAMDNAASGSDEERFIEEQMCKGVYTFPSISGHNTKCQETSQQAISQDVPISSIPVVSVPISVVSLQSQLNSQLEVLKERHLNNESMLTKLKDDIQTAYDEVSTIEKHSQTLSIKYQFFQEMRCYVKDLLLCLTEKVSSHQSC